MTYLAPRYDYQNQAWTAIVQATQTKRVRAYLRCGHPIAMDCECYGKAHANQPVPVTELARIAKENA